MDTKTKKMICVICINKNNFDEWIEIDSVKDGKLIPIYCHYYCRDNIKK